MNDRRRHPRVTAEQAPWLSLRLRTGDALSLVDLSRGGALVETSRRLLPGTTVVFQAQTTEGTMTLRAVVVRCSVHALRADAGVRYRGALSFGDAESQAASPHLPTPAREMLNCVSPGLHGVSN